MQYTQCKIVGNGSFGVVFQTKLAPNGEDAAIKRVLQDKRFKVFFFGFAEQRNVGLTDTESRTADNAHSPPSQYRRAKGVLLL